MGVTRSIYFATLMICCSFLVASASLLSAKEQRISVVRSQPANQQSEVKYRIFCVNGKIEIGQRDLNAMKAARGTQVCELGSFDRFAEAREASKRYGGVGAACSCK